jgi:pimeloyl-ACP methyl ester carboxylesterase
MFKAGRIVYIDGSESHSKSDKARQFQEWFPAVATPDFEGSFDERVSPLRDILADRTDWSLIGSSDGGLMATLFASDHESQLRMLALLSPGLMFDPFASLSTPTRISVPTILIH